MHVQHALSHTEMLLQCSACSEDAGALDDDFVVACLTDDLVSCVRSLTACR